MYDTPNPETFEGSSFRQWTPCPLESWDEVAEILTDSGKPWPVSAAITDLRWQLVKHGKRWGRYRLVKRWGWSHKRVSKLLKAEAVWADPSARGIRNGSETDQLSNGQT